MAVISPVKWTALAYISPSLVIPKVSPTVIVQLRAGPLGDPPIDLLDITPVDKYTELANPIVPVLILLPTMSKSAILPFVAVIVPENTPSVAIILPLFY